MGAVFEGRRLGRREFLRRGAADGIALGLAGESDAVPEGPRGGEAGASAGDAGAWQNWSRTASCSPAVVGEPDSEEAVDEPVPMRRPRRQQRLEVEAAHEVGPNEC